MKMYVNIMEEKMKLNNEQKKIGIKYSIMQMLTIDVFNGRYNELQKMYEALNLKNNDKLVKKLAEERNIGLFFDRIIYADIILVIADYIDERKEIVELADILYSKRCPRIKKLFDTWEEEFKSSGTVVISETRIKISQIEKSYLHFLFYRSEIFEEPDKILKDFDFERDQHFLNYSFYMTDKNPFDDQLIFCSEKDVEKAYIVSGKEEPVLSSKFFDRYLTNRRKDLADYLKIKENKLSDYIHSEMKSQSQDGKAAVRTGMVGLTETFTKNIIADQNGGMSWYNLMTTTSNSKEYKDGIYYIPDVDGLIRNYFKSYVVTKYIEVTEKKKGFTKLTLSRECIPENYETVYQTILCMYEMDVLYKMFNVMQKQYYKDFSWEKITNQDLKIRYEDIVSNLEQTIIEKENKINSLVQKNNMLSLQNTAENSKQTAPLVAENNKLLKVIESKENEIDKLKMQLQYQEEFISEINKPVVEDTDITYDLETLQSKRYLFVGHIADVLPELKYKFPNSVFMETETNNISNIEVDVVVMLIKWMSHSMFYKVKSTGALSQKKLIMCNIKNMDGILQKIYEEII